ncbi:hypothetical protein CMT77_07850 [Elizabethkingia anophelis]|nr:hypothetical protein [Elizabethkingia anophelis]
MLRKNKKPCPKCGGEMSQVAKVCFECRKNRIKSKCIVCESEFEYKASTNKQTCSRKCAYKLRGERSGNSQSRKVNIQCEKCGKQKLVSPAYENRRFCSSTCAYEFNSGENNVNWKGGISSERAKFDTSKEFKEARKKVWKRDNATCQRCGERFNHTQLTFEVHHIIPFEYEKGRCDIENLVLICNPCHNWIHSRRNTNSEFIKSVPLN